jgi:hypothetical protein
MCEIKRKFDTATVYCRVYPVWQEYANTAKVTPNPCNEMEKM